MLSRDHTPPGVPARLLTRKESAEHVTRHGFPTSPATLDTKVSRGGGQPYQKWGSRVLYEPNALLAWARAKLRPAAASSSELETRRA